MEGFVRNFAYQTSSGRGILFVYSSIVSQRTMFFNLQGIKSKARVSFCLSSGNFCSSEPLTYKVVFFSFLCFYSVSHMYALVVEESRA